MAHEEEWQERRRRSWEKAMAKYGEKPLPQELEERREGKRLDWLLDVLRHAKDPRWTRDNFISGVSNQQVRDTIDGHLKRGR